LWRDKLTLDPHDGLYVGDADVVDLIHLARHVEFECRQLRNRGIARISQTIAASPGKQALAFFNPMNWRRREIIEINAVFVTPGTRRGKVVGGEGRRPPHQLLKVRHMGRQKQELYYKEAWMLVEADIPASGYTTLYVEPDEGQEEPGYVDEPATILENRYARLSLGPGGIESLGDMTH